MIVGIDYDSFGIYVARLSFDEALDHDVTGAFVRFDSFVFRGRREQRADFAFPAVTRIPGMLAQLGVPQLVFVERGTGQSRRADFTLGRVQGAIVATFASWQSAPSVNELLASEWKKELTGNGNASKAEAHEALGLRFAGSLPRDENMRDVLAIAWTGRELNRRGTA